MALLEHLKGRAIFPASFAWFLEGPWRRLILSPDRLRQRLSLSPQMTVLELGAGGGYYARYLARFVRRYVALDIQARMLQRLRRRPGGDRCLPLQANALQLPLADDSVDLVIAVTVLGEVPSAPDVLAEVSRVLRPGGRLALGEHWSDPDFLPLEKVQALCAGAGLEWEATAGSRHNYTAVFRAGGA